MGEIRHFTDLIVWRKAHRLFLDILEDTNSYPAGRGADAVATQILDSSSSISANISEGFNRSQRRFVNCLDIALGEANETENWLYKVRDAEFLPNETALARLKAVIEIEKMLAALKRKISNNPQALREPSPHYRIWTPPTPEKP